MERRNIGAFEVSLLGLGTSRLASMGSGRSRSDGRSLLAAARDCEINFIDTADTYGSTAAERWIGELTAGEQEYWVVTTKTGLPTVDLPGPFRVLNQPAKKVKQARGAIFELEPSTLRRSIERSLRRLRRARIEIYLLHLPPEGVANNDEIRDILRSAQQEGVIAEFGVSSDNLATIRSVRDAWGSTCAETGINPLVQPELSVGALGEFDIIANHVMAGVPGEAALPPVQGAMSGNRPQNVRHRLLRHAAATPGVKVVLTGTSSVDHLRENVAALKHPVTEADLIARVR